MASLRSVRVGRRRREVEAFRRKVKGDAPETGRKDPSEEEMRLVWGASPRAWQLASTGCEVPMHTAARLTPDAERFHSGVACARGMLPCWALEGSCCKAPGTRQCASVSIGEEA